MKAKLGVVVSVFVVASFAAQTAMAEKKQSVHDMITGQGYGMAGCGLGSIAFGEKPGPVQIVAATLNYTAGNQTFAITTGTSNCDVESGDKKSASLFIIANRETLEKDISRGGGETIQNLSNLMGCQDATALGSSLQRNFGAIFPAQSVSTDKVVDAIKDTIKNDASLSKTCNNWA